MKYVESSCENAFFCYNNFNNDCYYSLLSITRKCNINWCFMNEFWKKGVKIFTVLIFNLLTIVSSENVFCRNLHEVNEGDCMVHHEAVTYKHTRYIYCCSHTILIYFFHLMYYFMLLLLLSLLFSIFEKEIDLFDLNWVLLDFLRILILIMSMLFALSMKQFIMRELLIFKIFSALWFT